MSDEEEARDYLDSFSDFASLCQASLAHLSVIDMFQQIYKISIRR